MRVLVVCGNYQQFRYYCKNILFPEDPNATVCMAQTIKSLYGFRPDKIVFYGTFYEDKSWPEIRHRLKQMQIAGEAPLTNPKDWEWLN